MAKELAKLSAPHHVMLELYLQGFKPGEIAEKLSYTREGVTYVLGSAPFQDALARRRANQEKVHDQTVASTVVEARAVLEGAARDAAEKLVEHMANEDPRVSLMSVKEILDRCDGLTTSSRPAEVQVLTIDKLQLLILAARESGVTVPELRQAS